MANDRDLSGGQPREQGATAEAIGRVGGPSLLPGETIRIDRITGNKIIEGGKRRSAFSPLPKPSLRLSPVEGLTAYISDLAYNFTWIRPEPIDEADAIDAQCRAGYPDTGYGFFGLNVTTTPEGLFRATWCSWKSCE
jgi:hypothetical protein